jgi:thiol:disulfide interchange protein DsbD
MGRTRIAFVFLMLTVSALYAQSPAPLDFNAPPAGDQLTISGSVDSRQGDQLHGVIVAKIADGWHVNSAKPLDDFVIPTKLSFENADLLSADYPAHVLKSFAFTNGSQLAVYEGTFRVPFTAKLHAGAAELQASVRYQSCNDRLCLPPKTAKASISLTPVASAPGHTTTTAVATSTSGAFSRLSDAPKGAQAEKTSLLSSNIGGTFASRGLPLTLLAIFILGLALNLTPCVYPLIPITIGYFSSQSKGSRSQRIALSVAYVVGLAITYSALGVFSALSGKLFGAWLQLPAVLIFFALLMLVMASSMFGAFEITVPHFISDRSGGRAGVAGAFTMGLLIGIVAAPCVGPFVISLIALVSQLASPLLGFLMFFVLALGLGVPYLILGVFSSGLSELPRSGMWMVQVKKAMGFILIAMAFYFLRPLTGDVVFRYGVAGSLLIGAAFLFLSKSPGARSLRLIIATLLLVSGVFFALPPKAGTAVRWERYESSVLNSAKAAGKPVVIDFYADWCAPCKELDQHTFNDPAVAGELQRFARIKANLTAADDPIVKQLTSQYAIVGVPTIVFIDGRGNEVPSLRLTGFEPPEKFVKRLAGVR